MEIYLGAGKTQYGTGVQIDLTGEDVALAILDYLKKKGVKKEGPATITVNGDYCEEGSIYVDPSGSVEAEGMRFSGRGTIEKIDP